MDKTYGTFTVRYAFGLSRLGVLAVVKSEVGIIGILVGENHRALREQLAETFLCAQKLEDQDGLAREIAAVEAYIDEPSVGFNLPLDMLGSSLNWKAGMHSGVCRTVNMLPMARAQKHCLCGKHHAAPVPLSQAA
jgi:AraC family transcriptional regulator of adaptative response/methylated-DNA-[protein]-cysteine methyltransferase